MKSVSGWKEPGNGDNSSGFNGLPGGFCFPDYAGFFCLTWDTYFWSTSQYANGSLSCSLHYDIASVMHINLFRQQGISIRCIKD
jgi:uncharacterized protein (TIGR02145 family)